MKDIMHFDKKEIEKYNLIILNDDEKKNNLTTIKMDFVVILKYWNDIREWSVEPLFFDNNFNRNRICIFHFSDRILK